METLAEKVSRKRERAKDFRKHADDLDAAADKLERDEASLDAEYGPNVLT